MSTVRLSASSTEKDEFDIPDLTDNSRRQLFRTKSKRHFSFRVSEEQRQQRRRCACAMRPLGGASHAWGRGDVQASPGGGPVSGEGRGSVPFAAAPQYSLCPQGDAEGPLCALQAHLTAHQLQPLGARGPHGREARRQDPAPGEFPKPITSLPGGAQPITGPSDALEPIAALCLPRGLGPQHPRLARPLVPALPHCPPNRLRKGRAEVAAALALSVPTASRRPRGAQPPWAATGSLVTRTPVRTTPPLPLPPQPSPKFPPLWTPDL